VVEFSSKLIFLIVGIGLLTCVLASVKDPEYSKPLDEMVCQYSKEMKDKFGFLFEGYGGELMCDVKEVDVSYRLYKSYTLEEIRVIIVHAEKRLIELLNTDVKIRPYLRDYPATAKNATLDLTFHDWDLSEGDMGVVDVSFIVFALCVNGKIVYYVNLREPSGWKSNSPHFKEVHRETFEEACRIVEKQASTEK